MSEKTEKVYVTIDEDRKEFLDTRNRYADIARKLANEFDRTFIMLIGGIRTVVATFLANKEGGMLYKEILGVAFIAGLLGIMVLGFSFYWSEKSHWLRVEECDEDYNGNTTKKEELHKKCDILNDRLGLCKIISLICSLVSIILIGVFLYINIPVKLSYC